MAQPTRTSPANPVIGRISYEEFLQEYSDVHAEWVDGEVIQPMAGALTEGIDGYPPIRNSG